MYAMVTSLTLKRFTNRLNLKYILNDLQVAGYKTIGNFD